LRRNALPRDDHQGCKDKAGISGREVPHCLSFEQQQHLSTTQLRPIYFEGEQHFESGQNTFKMFNALNRFISRLDSDAPTHHPNQGGSYGFQILRNKSPELAIEPWFDFIVGINGRMIVCWQFSMYKALLIS
jgi:hypothetical protein